MESKPIYDSSSKSLRFLIESAGPFHEGSTQKWGSLQSVSTSGSPQQNSGLHHQVVCGEGESRSSGSARSQRSTISALREQLTSLSRQGENLSRLSAELTLQISRMRRESENLEHARLGEELRRLEQKWESRQPVMAKLQKLEQIEGENAQLLQQLEALCEADGDLFRDPSASTLVNWIDLQRSNDEELIELSRSLARQRKEQAVLSAKINALQNENESLIDSAARAKGTADSLLGQYRLEGLGSFTPLNPKPADSGIFEYSDMTDASQSQRQIPKARPVPTNALALFQK